jgi:hypothetical protein
MMAMIGFAASASAAAGTLYQQEEGPNDDDPVEVDGAGSAPSGAGAADNWIHQYGGGTWSGVYAGSDGWITTDQSGDMDLEVEADIEMFVTQSIADNKIYFHIGNIFDATSSDLIAYVPGTLTSNNGQYIGISFLGTSKGEASFQKDGSGDYTGVILGGMQSDHHTYSTQDEQMDVEILLNWGDGWTAPGGYGDGAHGTITKTLWWLLDGGAAGTHTYNWRVRLLPEAAQADGDYYLDPAVVSMPAL